MANTITKTIRSKNLADFYTPTSGSTVGSISNSDFMSWLNQNYGDLPEDYKKQIIQAYSNYSGQVFTPDIWQGFGEALGNYSARQKFENSRFNNLNTAISEILNAYHRESYESPVNEVARMQAAGLNPDLNGGQGISPGSAGDIALPENLGPADSSGSSGVQELGNAILSLATTCMSFCQNIQGLKAGSVAIANQEIQHRSEVYNLISDTITRSISPAMARDLLGDDSNGEHKEMILSVVRGSLEDLLHNNTLSPHTRKTLKHIVMGTQYGSLSNQQNLVDLVNKYYKSYGDTASTVSSPFFSEDFSEMTKLLGEYYQKYVLEYEKLLKDFDFSKLGAVSEDGKSVGQLAGEANIQGLQYEKFQKANDKLVEDMWNGVMTKLEEKNKTWANVLIMLVPIFRSMLMSARVPSLSLNASVASGGHQNTTDVFMHKNE